MSSPRCASFKRAILEHGPTQLKPEDGTDGARKAFPEIVIGPVEDRAENLSR